MTHTQTAAEMCSRCKLSNCPGPDNCLIDCLTCDDEQSTSCPAENCDQGWITTGNEEPTTKCTRCKGRGEVRCWDC